MKSRVIQAPQRPMRLTIKIIEALQGLGGLFFPRHCLVCGRVLSEAERDLCRPCLEELPLTYQWDIVQNAAFERLARRFELEAAATLFFFGSESPYRRIIYGIKYGDRRALAERLGRLLGEHLARNADFCACQAVVPVPLHPLRHWKRGYNQAERIARGIAAALQIPVETKLLRRHRHTKTQTRLHGEAKTQNVKDAFRLNGKRASALRAQGISRLLLVDDVLTSGSTLSACAALLHPPGFRLCAATLAFASQ